jgi:hypothetical protein
MTELWIFLIGAALGAFWLDTMRAREAACAYAKRICEAERLQFLDDTVALESLRVQRASSGHVALKRVYGFEFSDTGNNRREGSVTVLGGQITASELEPYQELTPRALH